MGGCILTETVEDDLITCYLVYIVGSIHLTITC